MRVIGGSARGRRFAAPALRSVRPTADRVREAIFDVLDHLGAIEGCEVLDLFAGSGGLGIEALSRGAARVTFVESQRQVASCITANLAATDLADNARLVVGDALSFCLREPDGYDLALCDPPYAYAAWSELLAVVPARLVVLESAVEITLPPRFRLHRIYRYGTTLVTVARRAAAASEGARR